MSTEAALTWGRSDWGATRPGERLREASIDSYRLNLRANVRALWTGEWSMSEFIGAMTDTVERGIMDAWKEGAAKAGVAEDELTQAELDARMAFMWAQWSQLPGLATFVDAHSQANGGKLETALGRVDLWVNKYNEAMAQAQLMAKADMKWQWIVGPTEQSCRDCQRYNGRVYRASTWAKYQISPQNIRLACHGYRCLCRLVPTDLPANKGRPPAMTG